MKPIPSARFSASIAGAMIISLVGVLASNFT